MKTEPNQQLVQLRGFCTQTSVEGLLVSVIIPVWNDAVALVRCLEALEYLFYPTDSYEVFVVDNGSHEFLDFAQGRIHWIINFLMKPFEARWTD